VEPVCSKVTGLQDKAHKGGSEGCRKRRMVSKGKKRLSRRREIDPYEVVMNSQRLRGADVRVGEEEVG
jgi:hypothetical protein